MLLSFVIPAYNAANNIERCVRSITKSDVDKSLYEVVIIDDGSKDSTLAVCERLKKELFCIQVFHQENAGVSGARNRGLEIVQGDFIWFVDADDVVETGFVKKAIEAIKATPETELFCFNYNDVSTRGKVEKKLFQDTNQFLDGVDYICNTTAYYLWHKLFNRNLIGDKRFKEGIIIMEDALFCLETIKNAEKVICIPEVGYNYICTDNNSAIRSRDKDHLVKISNDSDTIILAIKRLAAEENDQRKQVALFNQMNFTAVGHLFALCLNWNFDFVKTVLNMYEKEGLYPLKKLSNGSRKANMFVHLANCKYLFLTLVWLKYKIKRNNGF